MNLIHQGGSEIPASNPKISIGMPVYQAEKYIRRALDSLLGQTYANFELIISDNASNDETSKICQEYANLDNRIKYVRQQINRGAAGNFEFVLNAASGEYFMWAAHDDIWSPDFIQINLLFLESNKDYVASVCPVRFDDGDFEPIHMGDLPLTGLPYQRFEQFFNCWHANSRFYSLFRTQELKVCPYYGVDFLGSDWVIMLYVIMQGKMNRAATGSMVRGHQGFSNSGKILKHYRKKWIHWFLPLSELCLITFKMSAAFPVKHWFTIIYLLAKFNWQVLRAAIVNIAQQRN